MKREVVGRKLIRRLRRFESQLPTIVPVAAYKVCHNVISTPMTPVITALQELKDSVTAVRNFKYLEIKASGDSGFHREACQEISEK